MKLRAVMVVMLVLAAALPAWGVQRMVAIEDFTNWTCPPCLAVEDSMVALFTEMIDAGKAVPIRPHVWWPDSGDPMWLGDQPDVTARVNAYNITSAPTFMFDSQIRQAGIWGVPPYGPFIQAMRTNVENRYLVPAAVSITINEVRRDSTTIYCSFEVSYDDSVEAVGATQRVYFAGIERNHTYVLGKEWYPFRGFGEECGIGGFPIAFANVGDSYEFDWTFRMDDPPGSPPGSPGSEENPKKMWVSIWVQKDGVGWSQKKILNAAYQIVPDPTDVVTPLVPNSFVLEQNSPNPFRPSTVIGYTLEKAGPVRLSVYDPSGRLVTDLVNGTEPAGRHFVIWNGQDRRGREVSSGIYYYRLENGNKADTRKMSLIR